jgi:hypothetical protein
MLSFIHTQLYKALFLRPADGLERSTENEEQYMIYDNDPILTRSIEVPKDMNQLSCMALFAGVIEAVMDGWGFVRLCILTFLPIFRTEQSGSPFSLAASQRIQCRQISFRVVLYFLLH